ncbi:class I SAM-dependent methyltransferase [Myxococcus sp. K15C18031901]|uniref:class I SAM-dependent methyltransferase n=1 Tax=Myxococcus dinghuensis TaxID=2906761 RepID=UPI0020A746AD|nr:class I SAM-dependent methyltransferase [Myxococcus dinghuensis]MCP3098801.1 class I SAM-dependent methyltransferase [Myxococcus dinghuensis]
MGITMSSQEYATAFRLLAATARHPENIERVVKERLVHRLPERRELLDVGAGAGKVAERLAPYFDALTLLEPNRDQLAGFRMEKARVLVEPFERYQGTERYDVVLCSHVLYHVPQADWGAFIERLLGYVRPGGYCILVMAAARGPTYALCQEFSRTLLFGEHLVETLRRQRWPHEVVATMSGFRAKSFEEMYTLCRFFVLEGCFTAEQLALLSPDETRQLDEKLRLRAERCREVDGAYRLEQDEDLILIPRP